MHHFARRGSALWAEDVPLSDIADAVGTPFYAYSAATLRRHARVFKEGLAGTDALVAFSVKALSNLSVLRLLAREGLGADIVSGGELARARRAGIAPDRIVFSGVGKTTDEIDAAIAAGILQFNAESEAELRRLSARAGAAGRTARVALRVNPEVDAGTLDGISTGRPDDKFGVPWDRAEAFYDLAGALPGLETHGVDVHIGSQITALAPFEAATRRAADLVARLRARGHVIDTLDLGGGLGVPYGDGVTPPEPAAYLHVIREITDGLGVRLIFEPGRMIAANAGVLVTSVILTKRQRDRAFCVVDAGMNDLIRPALYKARHGIEAVAPRGGEAGLYDVVGPVCESTDLFARDVALTDPQEGDRLAILSAGAYGAVQSSGYNTRMLVPEVLVDGTDWRVVRRRPSVDEVLALED